MQVVIPFPDLESALASDIGGHLDAECHAFPAPDGMAVPGVVLHQVGGAKQNCAAFEHDFAVHCYGATESAAVGLASDAQRAIAAVADGEAAPSGAVYKGCSLNLPYNNPDPNRPMLHRWSLSATVAARGIPIYE